MIRRVGDFIEVEDFLGRVTTINPTRIDSIVPADSKLDGKHIRCTVVYIPSEEGEEPFINLEDTYEHVRDTVTGMKERIVKQGPFPVPGVGVNQAQSTPLVVAPPELDPEVMKQLVEQLMLLNSYLPGLDQSIQNHVIVMQQKG